MIQKQKQDGDPREAMTCGKCITCTNNVMGEVFQIYKIKMRNTMTKTNITETKLILRRNLNQYVGNVSHVAKILKHYRDSNKTNEKGNHTDTEKIRWTYRDNVMW